MINSEYCNFCRKETGAFSGAFKCKLIDYLLATIITLGWGRYVYIMRVFLCIFTMLSCLNMTSHVLLFGNVYHRRKAKTLHSSHYLMYSVHCRNLEMNCLFFPETRWNKAFHYSFFRSFMVICKYLQVITCTGQNKGPSYCT